MTNVFFFKNAKHSEKLDKYGIFVQEYESLLTLKPYNNETIMFKRKNEKPTEILQKQK